MMYCLRHSLFTQVLLVPLIGYDLELGWYFLGIFIHSVCIQEITVQLYKYESLLSYFLMWLSNV